MNRTRFGMRKKSRKKKKKNKKSTSTEMSWLVSREEKFADRVTTFRCCGTCGTSVLYTRIFKFLTKQKEIRNAINTTTVAHNVMHSKKC